MITHNNLCTIKVSYCTWQIYIFFHFPPVIPFGVWAIGGVGYVNQIKCKKLSDKRLLSDKLNKGLCRSTHASLPYQHTSLQWSTSFRPSTKRYTSSYDRKLITFKSTEISLLHPLKLLFFSKVCSHTKHRISKRVSLQLLPPNKFASLPWL